MAGMKAIDYRGGVISFQIPEDWVEEYEHDGGATFYANEPDSGTLRLSILTLEGPTLPGPEGLMRAHQNGPGQPEMLPTGNTVVSYRKSATEDGEQLTIFYWTLANGVPPRHIRLAIFSYTIVERQVADAKVVAELAMLNHEIRAAVFSSSLGVLPA
jgi:hypothetical protein